MMKFLNDFFKQPSSSSGAERVLEQVDFTYVIGKLNIANKPDKMYLGKSQEYAHLIFDSQDAANTVASELLRLGLHRHDDSTQPVNVHPRTEGDGYFIRIHQDDFGKLGIEPENMDVRPGR